MTASTIRVQRSKSSVKSEDLLNPASKAWGGCLRQRVELIPTPISTVYEVSPYLAASTGHGKIGSLTVCAIHDGETLSLRLAWNDPNRDDEIVDLDRFVDACAVMFPLAPDANPLTMGDAEKPVNAWLWRANAEEPFDVIARGYSTSVRRPGSESGLRVRARYEAAEWAVVLQRPLRVSGSDYASFQAAGAGEQPSASGIAFAIWEGSNGERSAQKAISGGFSKLALDA